MDLWLLKGLWGRFVYIVGSDIYRYYFIFTTEICWAFGYSIDSVCSWTVVEASVGRRTLKQSKLRKGAWCVLDVRWWDKALWVTLDRNTAAIRRDMDSISPWRFSEVSDTRCQCACHSTLLNYVPMVSDCRTGVRNVFHLVAFRLVWWLRHHGARTTLSRF